VIAVVRSCLEEWFVDYPDDAKETLARRMRGAELTSSVFELYVYTLLRRLGYSPIVLEPKPQRAGKKMPDFRIESADGRFVFIEATTVDCTPDMSRRDHDLGPLHDALSGLRTKYRFSVSVAHAAQSPLPFSQCRKHIKRWFLSDRFAACRQQALGTGQETVEEEIISGEWVIEVTAYVAGAFADPPQPEESPIVLWSTGVHCLDPARELGKAVKRKAARYNVDGPLVLAVSPLGNGIERDEIEAALYGPTWESMKLDGSSTIERRGEGLWFTPRRTAKNRSVSAVLVCDDVHPTTLARPTPVLYHAPQPAWPVDDVAPRVVHARLDGLPVTYAPGASGRDLLGFPVDWP
jgi:hypothetical protein